MHPNPIAETVKPDFPSRRRDIFLSMLFHSLWCLMLKDKARNGR
jgi:hypothetical protein